jgi:type I restriction enzyme, S subunit
VQKPKPGYKIIQTKFRGNIEIPESWNLSKLGNECKFEYGKGLTEGDRDNEGFSVYGSGGIIGKNSKSFAKGPGIIVARKGSLGNVFFEEDDFWPIDTVFYISKNETKQNLQFLFYLLVHLKLKKYKIVTAHPGISREEIYTILIKIPPPEEQKKIVDILSNIDDLINRYDRIISQTKRLKQGLMQQILRKGIGHKKFKKVKWHYKKIIEIPESWKVERLGKLCELREKSEKVSDLYIGLEHIGSKNNTLEGKGNISDFSSTKNQFDEGDVLYGKLRPLLNKVWLATESGQCSTDILPIVSSKKIINRLLLLILSNHYFYSYAVGTSAGTKMPRANWTDIKKFITFLPSLPEQEKMSAILGNIDNKICKLESKKQINVNLKKNLMQKMLTGQIRT